MPQDRYWVNPGGIGLRTVPYRETNVEMNGFEPMTFRLPDGCSTN